MDMQMIEVEKIGAKIRGLRAEQGITSEELSNQVGVHKNTILRIERAELSDVGVLLLNKIAHAFDRTLAEFIKESQQVR